jgi:Protein of unknown function (DUF2934)
MISPGADAVRERAYHIWEDEGRPGGRDLDHWLQAERELARPARRVRAAKAGDPPTAGRIRNAGTRTRKGSTPAAQL